MENTDFVNVKEAAELLKVKTATIYQLVWKRRIPAYKPFGRILYFKRSELLALLDTNRRDTATEIETKAASYAVRAKK